MNPAPAATDRADPFQRVLLWRATGLRSRLAQAILLAVLVYLATGDQGVLVWLVFTSLAGWIDCHLSRRLLATPDQRGLIMAVCASMAVSAASFAVVGLFLLATVSEVSLAEAGLVLCVVCLNISVMTRGSWLAGVMLAGPACTLLVLSPFVARLLGLHLPMSDVLLLALGAVAYCVFIIRLSSMLNSESVALRRAVTEEACQSALAHNAERDALEGKQRWRMVFDQSPLPQICFNAEPLSDLIDRAAPSEAARLGDVLLSQLSTTSEALKHMKLLEANESAAVLFGVDRFEGRIDRAHFSDSFLTGFCRSLNEIGPDGVMPPYEARLIRADGTEVPVRVHQRMSPGQKPPWSLCLATYVDMSEAEQAASAQREALEASGAANRAKSDFLAVMSHEIRTPLNGVLGMAQAMERDALSRAQRDRLNVIRESGAALMDLLNDLLDLSKIEAGKLELEAASFDLESVVQRAHAAFSALAARKGLDFEIVVEPAAQGLYCGDAGRIRQIVCNLVSNALKFTAEGKVSLRLRQTDRGVAFAVTDTGIGIPPDRIGKLFGKFVQADTSTTREFGGSGLGLSICQELAHAMGGAIHVTSTPGEGSTFTADLPLERAAPQATEALEGPLHPTPHYCEGDMRILAAEDNAVNQLVLRTLLSQVGLTPTIVDNGAEAVRAWEGGHWDLILMDIQMPVMDGPSATRHIREREEETSRSATPIIALTANALAHQAASYRANGMNAVVSKPINIAELLNAIADVADQAEEDAAGAQDQEADDASVIYV